MLIKLFEKFTNWILFTSVFAAFCATGMCMATEKLLINHVPRFITHLHILVFCSTLLVYNVHYIAKKSSPEVSDRFAWSQHYKFYHYVLIVCGLVGCIYSVFVLPYKILLACIVLGLLSFAYSLPLLPFKNKRRLKDFGWIKILVLTLVWTIVTSVLPILNVGIRIADFPYEIMMRFVFMFILCIAFDIRDMQTDKGADIYTLPNIIGLKNSYRLMDVFMLLFVVFCSIQFVRYGHTWRLIAEVITIICTKAAIEYTRRYPSDKAYLGLVDGMMLLLSALILAI